MEGTLGTPATLVGEFSALGVVMGAHNTLWFTEAGSDKIGMLRP